MATSFARVARGQWPEQCYAPVLPVGADRPERASHKGPIVKRATYRRDCSSISSWHSFDMVNYQHVEILFAFFELQSEALLQGGCKSRQLRRAAGRRGVAPLQAE